MSTKCGYPRSGKIQVWHIRVAHLHEHVYYMLLTPSCCVITKIHQVELAEEAAGKATVVEVRSRTVSTCSRTTPIWTQCKLKPSRHFKTDDSWFLSLFKFFPSALFGLIAPFKMYRHSCSCSCSCLQRGLRPSAKNIQQSHRTLQSARNIVWGYKTLHVSTAVNKRTNI